MDSTTATAATFVVDRREKHTDGLTIRRRDPEVTIAAGSKVAVRVVTDARDDVTGREVRWIEA